MEFRPESQLKTFWYIIWMIAFVLGLVVWLFCIFFINPFIFSICLAVFIVIMILVIFWIPRAYRVLKYSLEDDSVKMQEGVVWKKNITVPYLKITNVDITQGPIQRALGIGVIHVQTAGAGGQQGQKAELKINGVKNLDELRDKILENIKVYHSNKTLEIEKPLFRSGDKVLQKKDIDVNTRLLGEILEQLSLIRKQISNKDISQ
jgi:membrane protein YdbS with pleckstrin-like domain